MKEGREKQGKSMEKERQKKGNKEQGREGRPEEEKKRERGKPGRDACMPKRSFISCLLAWSLLQGSGKHLGNMISWTKSSIIPQKEDNAKRFFQAQCILSQGITSNLI